MSIFSFFKTREKQKIHADSDTNCNEYLQELRTARLYESQPVLSRGKAENSPKVERFNFEDVLLATDPRSGAIRCLVDGDNAKAFREDISYINQFTMLANQIVNGAVNFFVDPSATVWAPYLIKKRYSEEWTYTFFVFEGLTPTGKQKKYPLSIWWSDMSGHKRGHFFYNQSGVLGKGSVSVSANENTKDFYSYKLDFINGDLSHIWYLSPNGEEKALYNKNSK